MKVTKAIETLEMELHLAERQPETGVFAAIKLGIEALKELKLHRKFMHNSEFKLLPGETPEEEVES